MALKILASALLMALTASAQNTRTQSVWGQCAGSGYAGPTACPNANTCNYGNPWYSQCIPVGSNSSDNSGLIPDTPFITASSQTVITIGSGRSTTLVTTYVTYLTEAPPVTAAPTPVNSPRPIVITSGGSVYTLQPDVPFTPNKARRGVAAQMALTANAPTPTILQSSQYWIRAVAAPNFHKYLQTSPANTVGAALLGSPQTAGQYNVVSGQLVALNPGGEPLYLHVEKPADLTQRALATWFNSTKNEFGTFAFSGDALTWEAPEIKRQNLAAWLVCKGQALFINTGAYAYQTPSGCADQTIHYYNGATAND